MTMSTNRETRCCIAWNDVSWSAWIDPVRRPVSCCGKEPFRDPHVEVARRDHRRERHHQRGPLMPEHPLERSLVARSRIQSNPSRSSAIEPPARSSCGVKQPRAHHRRRRQRHDHRDQNRDRQRDRELAEQPADDAAHQQNRDEHRHQRQADRDDGEPDLPARPARPPRAAPCPLRRGARCSR